MGGFYRAPGRGKHMTSFAELVATFAPPEPFLSLCIWSLAVTLVVAGLGRLLTYAIDRRDQAILRKLREESFAALAAIDRQEAARNGTAD
ncbi:hypothetical protein XEULMG905_20365 [Xanthomonas euvesicatoria]|nr:hypothetical protein XEULMG905_20365 [Xanthomonas euvesicatoria]